MPEELNLPPTTVVGILGNAIILADGRVTRVTIHNGGTTILPVYETYQETIPGTVAEAAVKKARGY